MADDTRWRLREATHAAHQRLEDRIDIFSRIAAPAGRRDLVVRFHRLHAAVEPSLQPWLAGVEGLAFEARRRTPALLADMAALSISPEPVEPEAPCRDRAEALGWLYVLEGSTLGGQVIRRRVEAGGGSMAGLSFLDPYGARAGSQWRSFLEVLGREIGPQDFPRALSGATAAFGRAEQVLCAPEPALA